MDHKICTFFGHRDCPASIRPRLRAVLQALIVREGVTAFYVGNQGAYDAMVQEVLREWKLVYPAISYAVVLAYMPKKDGTSGAHTLLPEGIENVPKRFAIDWRNRWMLDRAQYVVTYVTHSWGGAAKFAALAQKAREDRLSALK